MSNTTSATFGNCLQNHNLTSTIEYLNSNVETPLTTYSGVMSAENKLILDEQTAAFIAPATNPNSFYSTQLVGQAPNTILITNSFGLDEPSTISGVNNNFNNSSIRIVTHNNNNNTNHNNNNNNNNKLATLEDINCNMHSDKLQQQQYHHVHHLHHQPRCMEIKTMSPQKTVKLPNSLVTTRASMPTTTSTVVLDRINICINNHYGETTTTSTPPQSGLLPSPIIPPIIMSQHTTIVDTMAQCLPVIEITDSCKADMNIDEPDSTTSTNCDLVPIETDIQEIEKCDAYEVFKMQKFIIGEDALVKRRDGRYYLGTIVDTHRQQYLVQFDDKTDYWSNVDELKKLSCDVVGRQKPTCLACKQENADGVVEICERCGRGYHRHCTVEISPESGEWICKRCEKPMKYSLSEYPNESIRTKKLKKVNSKKQLPYALKSLTWDEKHRVNLEQIYCYCGRSGQFDHNMIQCCKCKQWFHLHCVECIKTLFRGDVFFIFGCSICNKGKEFLRRIEMKWLDLAHLILYNMSIMKNFQKYHHLHKDIYPFALEKRTALQLPDSMLSLSDSDFKGYLLKTLQDHPKLFQCGKEIKKHIAFWGLRANKPPQGPLYEVQKDDVLCNQLIKEKLKIRIIPYKEEEEYGIVEKVPIKINKSQISHPIKSKIELYSEPQEVEDDDDKFTSDDEIPIKLILEKVKKSNSITDLREPKPKESNIQDYSVLDDQLKDHQMESFDKNQKKIKEDGYMLMKFEQKSSRKRKVFTLSKGYKDSDKSNNLPRSICDSSSDENSSSSRGTLDLIIPPPKNFLGINNPFRIVTPKKSDSIATKSSISKKLVSFGNSFQNTLDLNSKIATLKNSGLFPNSSNSDFAKAAGQSRQVRTIKRRLSAKDIMIGPNQEIRRRRTRPTSSNVEVISTTTINPITSNFFPIRATVPDSPNNMNVIKTVTPSSQTNSLHISSSTSSSLNCLPSVTHGRRLRKRPEKMSSQNSRRNSICSSSSSSSTGAASQLSLPPPSHSQNAVPLSDLKQSVSKYFGATNRIENGEKFTIRAKRRLFSGQMQYLFEWES